MMSQIILRQEKSQTTTEKLKKKFLLFFQKNTPENFAPNFSILGHFSGFKIQNFSILTIYDCQLCLKLLQDC